MPMKEKEGGISRKSLWTQHCSKKVSAKLREHSQGKTYPLGKYYSVQGCPSPKSPSCSLIGWEQPRGSMVLIWTPRWVPRCSSWSLVSQLCPHHLNRFFRRWSALRTLWLPPPVGQKVNGENGGRGAGQKEDKSSRHYTVFLQEGKNPAFSSIFSPQFFESLHSYTVVDV